jgi:hypothetical protein
MKFGRAIDLRKLIPSIESSDRHITPLYATIGDR